MNYYNIIYNKLSELDNDIITKWWTIRACVRKITKTINQLELPAKVHSRIEYGEENHISGNYFDELDEDGKSPIRLNWLFVDSSIFKSNLEEWGLTKNAISIIVCHEIIHCEQFRSRNFECDSRILVPTEDYFSDTDEIQAFGFEAAMELKLTGDSPTVRMYLEKFVDHPKVTKEFLRWMYYYAKYE